jgi:hypothetical protein
MNFKKIYGHLAYLFLFEVTGAFYESSPFNSLLFSHGEEGLGGGGGEMGVGGMYHLP